MAILLDDQENKFFVKGEINRANSIIIQEYVESQFKRFSDVIMNIDLVSKIDKNGLTTLNSIYQNSLKQGKIFTITGVGCKEIYDDFLMLV